LFGNVPPAAITVAADNADDADAPPAAAITVAADAALPAAAILSSAACAVLPFLLLVSQVTNAASVCCCGYQCYSPVLLLLPPCSALSQLLFCLLLMLSLVGAAPVDAPKLRLLVC
jgi:hypothetical protein